MSEAHRSKETVIPSVGELSKDYYVISVADFNRMQGRLQEARRLMTDLRENNSHPRHEQWRQECDEWLASI